MFQTPQPPLHPPVTPAPPRTFSNALRRAGLMDRDQKMHDANDKHAGKKGSNKFRSHRPRLIDTIKEQPGSSRNPMLASRIGAASSTEPLSIRGAARPTTAGRLRRNAISVNGVKPALGTRVALGKPVDIWRQFVQKRFNPELRFLNLERMGDDELLGKAHLLPPGVPGSSSREAAVIFKLASQLKPSIKTVSLANNNLTNTHVISTIAHYLPGLSNLSLENNQLRVWKDLDSISQLTDKKDKLSKLRELVLLGNPIREFEYQHNRGDSYKNNIMRRFPTLEMLDQEPVAKISFDAPETSQASAPSVGPQPIAKTFPANMQPSFVTGVDDSLITGFLARFFPMYDTQRHALKDVYNESATFSFQANTSIPARARIQGFQRSAEMPNQRNLEWSKWLGAGSRNLTRVGGAVDKMLKSLHIGREEAMNAMMLLPQTRHEIAGAPEKFSIDAWPVVEEGRTTLFLSIHGQFTEEPAQGVRSFDRSFVLAPAPDGSRAKASGWNIEILSDQLVIRAYSSHEAWRPGPLLLQALNPAGEPSVPSPAPQGQTAMQEALNAIPEPQRSLVAQICQRTNLNVKFAVDCLQGNGWNFEAAVANFEQVKATLGREAFL
ncbi:hypothetical protein OF83DRAFT_647408 [Amylostereum chailletii]|nr:hypothetical protein OF83DRAFT_647408 [Amylostereum chailletii]